VKRNERWIPALVLGATALLYAPSLAGDWVWDDFLVIANNPAIPEPGRLVTEDMWGPTGHRNPISVAYYRPLGMLSFYPGQVLWGGPLPERLANLALHLAAIALVAGIARGLGAGTAAAWFGAACFAWHPAVSEPVAWCSGRFDLLGNAALLGALWAHQRGRGRLAAALLFAAPFCKDGFAAAPLAVAIWCAACRLDVRRPTACAAAGAAAYWLVRSALAIPLQVREAHFDPIRLLGAVGGFAARGAQLLVDWKAPDALAYYEPRPGLGALAIAACCAGLAALRGRVWLGLLLAPLPLVALSVPAAAEFGIVGDRYFYPLFAALGVGAALAFDALLRGSPRYPHASRWLPYALAALPIAWAPFAAIRATEWRDNGALYRASLARNPDNAMAAYNVGHYEQFHRENCAEAIPMYERAVGRVFEAGIHLDTCLRRLGRLEAASRASRTFAEAYPQLALAASVAAEAHLAAGALPDAERWAREAIRRAPGWSGGHVALARVLAARGCRGDARTAYDRAVALAPGDRAARAGRARLLDSQPEPIGRVSEACGPLSPEFGS
jgi:tetratricopeptide (TPR) repeat protein